MLWLTLEKTPKKTELYKSHVVRIDNRKASKQPSTVQKRFLLVNTNFFLPYSYFSGPRLRLRPETRLLAENTQTGLSTEKYYFEVLAEEDCCSKVGRTWQLHSACDQCLIVKCMATAKCAEQSVTPNKG